jgi:hypothetical protein
MKSIQATRIIHDIEDTRSTLMPTSRAAHARAGEDHVQDGHEREGGADDSEGDRAKFSVRVAL